MTPMTSHERFRRMFAHQEADRIPIIDSPWAATVEIELARQLGAY